jgi:hypothetical protein
VEAGEGWGSARCCVGQEKEWRAGRGAALRGPTRHERDGSGPLGQRRARYEHGRWRGASDVGAAADKWGRATSGPVTSDGV